LLKVLNDVSVSRGHRVGVLAKLVPRSTLPEQVPTAVELDLHLLKALMLPGVGITAFG
jgi:hypothetical protein